MKKLLFLLLFISQNAFSFVITGDYVYGIGQTDSAAIVSLARSISVSVKAESRSYISEKNKKIDEEFEKKIILSSSLILRESKLEYEDGIYYRYIDKNEYTSLRLEKYRDYCKKAEGVKDKGYPHEQNFRLGYYYKAYCALTDGLMPYFLDEYSIMKESLLSKIKEIYFSKEYSDLFLYRKEWYGYRARMFSSEELVGFEFENEEGKWVSVDTYFYNDTVSNWVFHGNEGERRYCSIRYPKLYKGSNGEKEYHYRLTYEIFENGNIEKIIVPDEFYFDAKEFLYI